MLISVMLIEAATADCIQADYLIKGFDAEKLIANRGDDTSY